MNFGVGVVTGFVDGIYLWNQFGGRSRLRRGDFVGHILGFETVLAFMLEAGFLGVMLFGWGKVPKLLHLFATSMVTLGTVLSAFWIMVVSSWMQTPAGVEMIAGKIVVNDYWAAIFNPDFPFAFTHMMLACLQNSLVVVGGISAWYLLKKRDLPFFLPSFKAAAAGLAIVGVSQVLFGDLVGSMSPSISPPNSQRWKRIGIPINPAKVRRGLCWQSPIKPTSATSGRWKSPMVCP